MNSRLSATSPQPSKMFLLPACAEPSSIGELSPQKNTRPLPYCAEAAITPVRLVCGTPVIHTSPRTVGLTSGCSVNVVPLWNASAATLPIEPRVTLSEAAVHVARGLHDVVVGIARCCPSARRAERRVQRFQIFGESKPSLLRSET